jgi:hypothetical protein
MHPEFMPRLKPHKATLRASGLISACAFAAALGCATMEPTIPAEPGVAFDLPVGKTATLNGDGVRITFKQVKQSPRARSAAGRQPDLTLV